MPDAWDTFVVECVCGAGMCGYESMNSVVERWNKRAVVEPSAGWIVQEQTDDGWRRHALAHVWHKKSDARLQLDELMHKHPTTTFRLIEYGAAEPPATEHPPELMAVVDKWQDRVNAMRTHSLPSVHGSPIDAIADVLEDIRRATAPPETDWRSILTQVRAEIVSNSGLRNEYQDFDAALALIDQGLGLTKSAEYTHCDICDERPGTHEIAWGGVRCDECREHAERNGDL